MRRFARSTGIAIGILALPWIVGFGLCSPTPSPPPEPRGCPMPADGAVITGLEVGEADGIFAPSTRATPMFGGQGLPMLGYRIAVQSSASISCIATSEGNLRVIAEAPWYVTDPIWTIVDSSSQPLPVSIEAYGMRIERVLRASGGPLDAGNDTGIP